MERNWIETFTEKHYIAIGQAVTAWGELERTVNNYLARYISQAIVYEFTTKKIQSFKIRCDFLKELIAEECKDDEKLKQLGAVINEAKQLSDRRNTIAHNPIAFWLDIESKDVVGRIVHSRTGNDTEVDLEAINKFTDEAEEIKYKLMDAMVNSGDSLPN